MSTPVKSQSGAEFAAEDLGSDDRAPSGNGYVPEGPRRPEVEEPALGVMDGVWFLPRQALKLLFFFPKLVDRYVIGELLGPLGFGWSMFILIFVCSFNLFRL